MASFASVTEAKVSAAVSSISRWCIPITSLVPQPSRFTVFSRGALFSLSEVVVLSLTLSVPGVFSHVRLEISLGVGISVLVCVDSGFFMLRGGDVHDTSSLGSFGVDASVLARLDFGMSSLVGVVGPDSLQPASFEVDAPVLVCLEYEQTSLPEVGGLGASLSAGLEVCGIG